MMAYQELQTNLQAKYIDIVLHVHARNISARKRHVLYHHLPAIPITRKLKPTEQAKHSQNLQQGIVIDSLKRNPPIRRT